MAVGNIALMWAVGRYASAVTTWQLTPALLISGLGMGMVVSTLVVFTTR